MAIGNVTVTVQPDFSGLIEGLRNLASHFTALADDAIRAADELEDRSADEEPEVG
ncbi:hypothetical protein PBI_MYXUS_43 [Mycobacterium phage Myxus]|uniref:Uncharacterized protein n=9 Tax=Fromanvirus TaxID=186764 RepID=A0A142K4V1_9CAUD|nr:hypothetical protein AVV05_gp066 [Mycobacterium phage Pioneer]YP_009301866.1 hypothetical protein BJD80_gp067 [Mycobacterium phage Catalina]YP_009636012.1 hypothetical protein FGG56_gp61 [Mycobacterium phage PackMan]AMO43911.1 hypothetical protein PBI_MYXUS_43 [Mycobacterium phage Myxus]AMS00843.1 hypothetical protein PBI_EIDSMOE_43 [Mycobacterium phage Eidsmoe]AOQ28999.1 hypothetical protein SEA_HORTUMSL17_43 [Mycobacterium phage HortumSL17]AOT26161.1 hypothetical protein SEA_QOBBIT_43 [M